jgi:hypothetical protein
MQTRLGVNMTPIPNPEQLRRNTFIGNYLEYVKYQQSPDVFHLWSAFAIIAAALGRSVWVARGYWSTFPNMYIAIVSKSAVCSKSSASDIAVRDVMYPTFNKAEKYIVTGNITPSAFNKELAERYAKTGVSEAFVYADEMAAFFTRQNLEMNFPDVLTRAYTCPHIIDNNTRAHGLEEIHNPCWTLLTTTTPEFIRKNVKDNSFKGGFIGRFSFTSAEMPKTRIAHPQNSNTHERDKVYRQVIQSQLRCISEKKGAYKWTEDTEAIYERWYNEYPARLDPDNDDQTGAIGRLGETVIKIAMLISASEYPYENDYLVFTNRHIMKAIELAEQSFEEAQRIFVLADSPDLVAISEDVKNFIYKRRYGSRFCDIMKHFRYKILRRDMEHIVDTLCSANVIEKSGDRFVRREPDYNTDAEEIDECQRETNHGMLDSGFFSSAAS